MDNDILVKSKPLPFLEVLKYIFVINSVLNLNIIIQLDLGQWDRVKSFVNLNKKGSESHIENRFSVLDSVFCSNALTYIF